MFGWLKRRMQGSHQPGSTGFARDMLAQAVASWEAYKLARRDRPRESYQPHGYSGDSAIVGSHDLAHRRTRDMMRNEAQTKSIIQSLVDLIVGTGIETYSWPFAPSELYQIVTELESLNAGELGPRLTYALESDDLFDQWFDDPKQFDIEQRLSGPEVQRMLLQESALVGTGLLVRTFRKDFSLVPLCYQLIEQEQLDETQDRPAGNGQNKIVGGREFDKNNAVVAYHIFIDHPQEFFGIGQSTLLGAGVPLAMGSRRARISADRVIDLTLFSRPSASGGFSWLDAAGQTMWDLDSYKGSEIRSAAVDSVIAFAAYLNDAEKSGGLGFDDGTDDSDQFGNRSFKLGHSSVAATLSKDEKLELVRNPRPSSEGVPFIKGLDRDTAASVGLSYYSLTGDYEATNYSSARAAKLDEDTHIRPLQNWVASRAALRIRKEFNAIAAALGCFQSVSPAEFRRNQSIYQRFDAIGNGRDLMDPFKEGEARTTRLRTGLSTFKEECARVGKHWIRVLMQIAIERKVATIFGVSLDFSKQGGGKSNTDEVGKVEDTGPSDDQAEAMADRIALILEDRLNHV